MTQQKGTTGGDSFTCNLHFMLQGAHFNAPRPPVSPPPFTNTHDLHSYRNVAVQSCRTSGLDEEAFGHVHNAIRRGDLVGVKGYPGKSKRGELSVFPTSFIVLAPCLHMLPKYRLDNQVSLPYHWLLSVTLD